MVLVGLSCKYGIKRRPLKSFLRAFCYLGKEIFTEAIKKVRNKGKWPPHVASVGKVKGYINVISNRNQKIHK